MSKVEPKEDEQVVYVIVKHSSSGTAYHYDENCHAINGDSKLRKSTEEREEVWRDGCGWCTEE